jgi:hypothetical protein
MQRYLCIYVNNFEYPGISPKDLYLNIYIYNQEDLFPWEATAAVKERSEVENEVYVYMHIYLYEYMYVYIFIFKSMYISQREI